MSTHSHRKFFLRFGLLVTIALLLMAGNAVNAQAEQIFMTIGFNPKVIGLGQTAKLDIVISNAEPNPVRVTSLQCTPSGSAATASAISPMPTTLGVEATFITSQSYRGVAIGSTTVSCNLTAVDTVTGATYTASSIGPATVDVISQVGLYFTAYSATRVATVGQAVFVISKFGNRGKTAYTNLNLSCVELGRALEFVSSTPLQSTIPAGQSGFVESRWLAVRTGGGPISCAFTATESVSGKQITIMAPLIQITVK